MLKVQVSQTEKQLQTKPGGKTYTPTMRMMVYDAIVCQVPTYNSYTRFNNQDLSEMWCYSNRSATKICL